MKDIIMQSHWSKPVRWQFQNQGLGDQLVMYALSAHTLRKSFDCPVFMVTDSKFASILHDLPKIYDAISTELDDIGHIDKDFWAFPKFHIDMRYGEQFAKQNTRIIQCDTDVFFWEPMQIGATPDILVQSIESSKLFENGYKLPLAYVDTILKKVGANVPYWDPGYVHAFNCGVVMFKDGRQAAEYAYNATTICEAMTPYLNSFRDSIPIERRRGTIMIIPEQYYLMCYAVGKESNVAYVSTRFNSEGFENYHPQDYYHMMGDKTDTEKRTRLKTLAEKEIPEIYEAIMKTAYSAF